jgi:hypothetical protein
VARGGGEGGSNKCANSVGAKLAGPAMASAGWETAVGSGRTKITAVVSEEALSCEQDIAQAVIPFPAW